MATTRLRAAVVGASFVLMLFGALALKIVLLASGGWSAGDLSHLYRTYLAMAVFFGTLLGVGLAIGLELLNRRVRSPRDLSEALGIPLLGSISHVGVKA